jgi:hypothetical protein
VIARLVEASKALQAAHREAADSGDTYAAAELRDMGARVMKLVTRAVQSGEAKVAS